MNDIATQYLQAYAAGAEAPEGWLFGKALQQARLDYTPESLDRLDALLSQIRERVKPTRAELDSAKGRNFASLVVFYVMELVRRISHAEITWHDRASALAVLPPGTDVPDVPTTRLLANALDQGMLMKPLAWLEGQLLVDGEHAKAADYVASLVTQLRREGRPEWATAMYEAGRLAASQMMTAVARQPVWPRMVSAKDPATLLNMPEGDLAKALQVAEHMLNQNPDNALWQVMAYAGYHPVNGARHDAVIVLAATYAEMGARIRLAFPYLPALAGQRFTILRPVLVEANLTVETMGKLGGVLDRGIREFPWPNAGSWNEYYVG